MKGVLWLILLTALAVAVTLIARESTGYVIFVAGGYRVELSLNLLIVLLLAGFVGLYLAVRLVANAFTLPRRVREYRLRRRQRRGHHLLLAALSAYFQGEYARAEKAALKAKDLGEAPVLCSVLAAHSAHRLRLPERRDAHLKESEAASPEEGLLRDLARAEFLLAEGDAAGALAVMEGLQGAARRPPAGLLALALEAHRQAGHWDELLALLKEAEKRQVLDSAQAEELRRLAHIQNLQARGHDLEALRRYWESVPARDQEHPQVAAAAARAFLKHKECRAAHAVIERALTRQWAPELLEFYAECPEEDPARQLQQAERWLTEHPDDAALLLALGKLCAQARLWGKAQSYLEASLSLQPSHAAYLALAGIQERLDRAEEARAAYRRSLELALERLGAPAQRSL
jgi:HemY protein